MIKGRYNYFIHRGLPEKKIKYEKKECNHLTNEFKKKLYEYYICDNCGNEIKITKKWERSNGGVVLLPTLLTKNKEISVALCNKCLNLVIKEFEEV